MKIMSILILIAMGITNLYSEDTPFSLTGVYAVSLKISCENGFTSENELKKKGLSKQTDGQVSYRVVVKKEKENEFSFEITGDKLKDKVEFKVNVSGASLALLSKAKDEQDKKLIKDFYELIVCNIIPSGMSLRGDATTYRPVNAKPKNLSSSIGMLDLKKKENGIYEISGTSDSKEFFKATPEFSGKLPAFVLNLDGELKMEKGLMTVQNIIVEQKIVSDIVSSVKILKLNRINE